MRMIPRTPFLPFLLFSLAVTAGIGMAGEPSAAHAARLAGICGAGTSGIQVQNLDSLLPATVVADFYDSKGTKALTLTRPNIAPFGSTTFWLPGIPELANGAYAMIVHADREIGAISRTDWASCGGAAIYSNPAPEKEVLVPLVVRQPGTQVSLVGIQNTDTEGRADVTVEIYQPGNPSPIRSMPLTLAPAASGMLDLGTDPNFATLPPGFYGSMRIVSTAKVAAQTYIDLENSAMAVSGFEGVPSDQASATVFVPLFRSGYFGTTGISVVNPGATAADVTVTYVGSGLGGTCQGQTIVHNNGQAVSIPARSSAVFYQGGMTPEAGPPGLPVGCFGSAVVAAAGAGRVLAVVNDFTTGAGGLPLTAAAYNAIGANQGARKVAVPLWRIHHTTADLVSGIQAMNLSAAQAAGVKITFFDDKGQMLPGDADRTPSIAPNGSYTWYTPSVSGIGSMTGVYGSAVIESDQPLAVIVTEVSLAGKSDAVTYNGIGADAAGGAGMPLMDGAGGGLRFNVERFLPAAATGH
jgi:hypothetical protein